MRTLVLVKSSTVTTEATVDNQCKQKGHREYNYDIEITTTEKLDDSDFIIDHTLVHKQIEYVVRNNIGSCEQLCLRIERDVLLTLKEHGCEVLGITLAVKPKESNAYVKLVTKY